MTKKIVFAFAIMVTMLVSSCKKDGYVSQYDMNKQQRISDLSPAHSKHMGLISGLDRKRTPPADGKYPLMTFAETEHNFGGINPGDKVQYTFKFTNTGEADLIIDRAMGSCGCTVPEYPKEPIKVNESAEIKVYFNSAGKQGEQTKTVTINTNTKAGVETLTIKASINDANKTS
jgi:hypothetical protein